MSVTTFDLHLKGYVGGWDFDSDYVDWFLSKHGGSPVSVLIDSLGGQLKTALSVAEAFRRHGDVTVHYSGMNASAATIAGMGARHITMDPAALWLVHKSSYVLDIYSQHNTDDMAQLIEELEKSRKDLETFDRAISALYARRCKKTPQELSDLMSEAKWITAGEALEWGFVDELTETGTDMSAGKVPESVVMAMKEAGIPLPSSMATPSVMERVISAVRNVFRGRPESAAPETPAQEPETDTREETPGNASDFSPETLNKMEETNTTQAPATSADAVDVADLQARLAAAEARVAELEGEPGADTAGVVDSAKTPNPETRNNPRMAAYFEDLKTAHDLYDSLP